MKGWTCKRPHNPFLARGDKNQQGMVGGCANYIWCLTTPCVLAFIDSRVSPNWLNRNNRPAVIEPVYTQVSSETPDRPTRKLYSIARNKALAWFWRHLLTPVSTCRVMSSVANNSCYMLYKSHKFRKSNEVFYVILRPTWPTYPDCRKISGKCWEMLGLLMRGNFSTGLFPKSLMRPSLHHEVVLTKCLK